MQPLIIYFIVSKVICCFHQNIGQQIYQELINNILTVNLNSKTKLSYIFLMMLNNFQIFQRATAAVTIEKAATAVMTKGTTATAVMTRETAATAV